MHEAEQASTRWGREREELERQLHSLREDRDWYVVSLRRTRRYAQLCARRYKERHNTTDSEKRAVDAEVNG